MTRRPRTSIVASPVLVGAVTLLVTIVGVFLAYQANTGLPFVPTYDLRAELPSGAKLLKGNDVRVGGFRIGVVTDIEPAVRVVDGRRRAVAVVDLKLDRSIQPLAADTLIRVRPRSPLGLKYIEVTPGRSRQTLAPGATLPLTRTSEPLELEDVNATFDAPTRDNARAVTQALGDAVAGRGPSLNDAVRSLNPFFRHLTPVARTLGAPSTGLDTFVRELGQTAGELAPVARPGAELFAHLADTAAAIARDPAALDATIARSPETLAVTTRSLGVIRPVVAEAAALSRELRPAGRELPRALPPLNAALAEGIPALEQSLDLSRRLRGATHELGELLANPSTLLALKDLRTALTVLRPAISFIAPYQTVCNFTVYFLHPLGEHQSQPVPGGTVQQQAAKFVNLAQPNTIATTFSSRPWDLPPGEGAQGAEFAGQPAGRAMGTPYQPAIDEEGKADCQNGQVGYPDGSLTEPYVSTSGHGLLADGTPAGGNAAVAISDYPGRAGGTYKSRQLGIDGLEDVP